MKGVQRSSAAAAAADDEEGGEESAMLLVVLLGSALGESASPVLGRMRDRMMRTGNRLGCTLPATVQGGRSSFSAAQN